MNKLTWTLAPVNLSLFARNYKQPFTQQVRGQFERQIFRDISFFATYEMFRGRDLPRARNVNLGDPADQTLQIYDRLVPTGESLVIHSFEARYLFLVSEALAFLKVQHAPFTTVLRLGWIINLTGP